MKLDQDVRIHITAKDIRLGQRASGMKCPAARALQRLLRRNGHTQGVVTVGIYRSDWIPYSQTQEYAYFWTNSRELNYWITQFDDKHAENPPPGFFTLKARL